MNFKQSQAKCKAFLISEEKEATLQDKYNRALGSKLGDS